MTSVGDHGLSCLDDSSYAAVALSMQANANAINAALSDIQASFDSYTYMFDSLLLVNAVMVYREMLPRGGAAPDAVPAGTTIRAMNGSSTTR